MNKLYITKVLPDGYGNAIDCKWIRTSEQKPYDGQNVEVSDDGINSEGTADYKTDRRCMMAGIAGGNGYFSEIGFASDGSTGCDKNLILDAPEYWRPLPDDCPTFLIHPSPLTKEGEFIEQWREGWEWRRDGFATWYTCTEDGYSKTNQDDRRIVLLPLVPEGNTPASEVDGNRCLKLKNGGTQCSELCEGCWQLYCNPDSTFQSPPSLQEMWTDMDMVGFAGYYSGRIISKPSIFFTDCLNEYKEMIKTALTRKPTNESEDTAKQSK